MYFAHSHRTRKEMQRKIDVELREWHDLQIADITRLMIKEWAVDEEIVDLSPALRLPRYGEETERERVLSADEINRLWPAFGKLGYPFGDIYRMMLCTARVVARSLR